MPSSAEILAGLTSIANEAIALAIGWHVVLAVALLAAALGWRPRPRVAELAIAGLLASVATLAFAYDNPFNGAVFAAAAVALVALSSRDRRAAIRRDARWAWWTGVAMIAFGWVYPHFVDVTPAGYLIAAPVGLVPCPTLAVAIGVSLLGSLGTHAWRRTLAGVGLGYAVFGVARLGVALDLGLMVGAVALAVTTVGASTTRWTRPLLSQRV